MSFQLAADLKEKERLGEAAARSLEEEEHRKRVDSSHQEDYDGQMAEILSQEYILREFVSVSMSLYHETFILYL